MATNVDTKYESDSGRIYPLRLTPAYAAIAGTEPTGGITEGIPVKVSGHKNSFALTPRHLNLVAVVGTAPNTYRVRKKLVLRSKADATAPAYAIDQTVTIGGVAYTIKGLVNERIGEL